MDCNGKACILIPAYNPCKEQLIKLVDELKDFIIIIVDDGSSKDKQNIFSYLESFENIIIIHHNKNFGKGMALKTGINYFLKEIKHSCGIVTCDADGQHLPCDIRKVANKLENQKKDKLLLGYRTFDRNVPLRSKIGNILTQTICSFLLGKKIYDTQTGLRGIPSSFLPEILKIKYNRYEFEMAMIIELSSFIEQINISTVYIDNNSSSHFNPAIDSLLIYFVIFKHIANSIASAVVDYIIFVCVYFLTNSVLFSLIIARALSMIFNFAMGKIFVFKSKCNSINGAIKYMFLALSIVVLDYIGILFLEKIGVPVFIGKIIVEFLLFFLAFFIQKKYIFTK